MKCTYRETLTTVGDLVILGREGGLHHRGDLVILGREGGVHRLSHRATRTVQDDAAPPAQKTHPLSETASLSVSSPLYIHVDTSSYGYPQ